MHPLAYILGIVLNFLCEATNPEFDHVFFYACKVHTFEHFCALVGSQYMKVLNKSVHLVSLYERDGEIDREDGAHQGDTQPHKLQRRCNKIRLKSIRLYLKFGSICMLLK